MRDAATLAIRLYKKPSTSDSRNDQMAWAATCQTQTLLLDLDPAKTGRGLGEGDAAAKVVELYGEPDSRSPSTKAGQPLELMYYAFDWAGPDVPQVMEVCTKAAEGKPGRVMEITLAAPSL